MGHMATLTQRLYQAAEQGDALAGEALDAIRDLVDAINDLLRPGGDVADVQRAVANAHAALRKVK